MEYGLFPIWSGWISQEYSSSHKGIDIGWLMKDGENLPVRAWKSGTVIASGTDTAGGVYVVIRHEDNQWSGYWHLVKGSNIANGTVVKQGQTIGKRGNTGQSSGTHLHFLITRTGMPTLYTYNKMVANTVNPIPLCYKYKTDNIEKATSSEQYPLPIMPEVPKPVARNEKAHQVEVLASMLRVRTKPTTSGDVIGFSQQGFFNVLQQKEADGYIWDEIEKDRWIATNDEEGWTKDLPDSSLEKQIEALKAEIADLSAQNASLTKKAKKAEEELATAKSSLKMAENRIATAVEVLTK